jgi:hypothetical protein
MREALAEFIIAIFDLIEAEGRLAKKHLVRLGGAFVIALAALPLVLAAFGALVWALYLSLVPTFTPVQALLICSLVLLLLAALMVYLAKRVL